MRKKNWKYTICFGEPFDRFELWVPYTEWKRLDEAPAMTREDRIVAFRNYEKSHGEMAYYVENEFDGNGMPIDGYDPYLWIVPQDREPEENWREITVEDAAGWTVEHGYGDCEVCAGRKLTATRIEEAVKAFCENPKWRDEYDNAPRGEKEYLRMVFTASHFSGLCEKNEEELEDWREDLHRKLKVADWEYLIAHVGTNGAAGMAKKNYREHLAIAKDREALKREKQSGTRLIRELRKAYRDWDSGRITTKQYNDEAHRIEDIESRLEAAVMIGDTTAMKLHDICGENNQAVNDIFDM